MLKLLYKPTGNVFTLPDEEALNIKKNDRGNDYVILDAGLQEVEEETITQEEVKTIEEKAEEQKEAQEEADKEPEETVEEKSSFFKTFDISDITKLKKDDLVVLANKIGLFDMDNKKKEDIIKAIQEKTGEKV